MINKNHIEETRELVSVFIELFDSFANVPVRNKNPDHSQGLKTGRIAFRVTGEMQGYILAVCKNQLHVKENQEVQSYYAENMVKSFREMTITRKKLSGFNLETINDESIDEILYFIRKKDPQISLRVNTSGYVVELYAFTDKNFMSHSSIHGKM